jgi:hypothetical protein
MITKQEFQKGKKAMSDARQLFGKVALDLTSDNAKELSYFKVMIANMEHDLEHLQEDFDEFAIKIQGP